MRAYLGLVFAVLSMVGFSVVPSGAAAPAPVITSLSPRIGPVTGGQTITVAGSGFTGVQKVVFQNVVAPTLRVLSDTKLTMHAPRHVEGTFNVRVVTDHGSSPTQGTGNDYTFTVPVVRAVSPAAGPTGGANTVDIEGDGIVSVTRVLFGSTSTSRLTHVDDHRITVVVPKHAAGVVHVRVVGGHGESDPVLADRYRFVGSLPTITWSRTTSGRAAKLSCATPSLCVAINNSADVYTYHGTTFDGPTAVGISYVTAVSCARASSYCLLAGGNGQPSPLQPGGGDQVSAYDGRTFAAPTSVDVGGDIVDVACDAASSCVAIGAHEAAVLRDGVWQAPQTIDSGTTLTSLSCPTAGFCLAADSSGDTTAFDGSTWSAPQEPYPYNSNPNRASDGPYFVDCTSSDYCVLDASSYGSAIARRHGVWGRLSSPEGSRGTGGLSCATPDFCVLVPNSEDFNLDLLFDGAESAYTDLARPSSYGDVSCPSTTMCAAAIDGGLYIGVAR